MNALGTQVNGRLLTGSCISVAAHFQHYFLWQKLTEASGSLVVAIVTIPIAVVTDECMDESTLATFVVMQQHQLL